MDEIFYYHATLDIPAWPEVPPRETNRLRPMLFIMRREYLEFEPIIQLSISINHKPVEDRWLVQFFAPERRGVYAPMDLSSPSDPDRPKFRRPVRWEGGPGVGEARNPRASLKDAISLALEQLSDLLTPKDLTALTKVIEMLKPTLETATRAYVQKWRPRS